MEEKKITQEAILAAVKDAKSPEDIIAFVKEYGGEMSEEEAKNIFDAINAEGELSDEQLDTVSGGNWLLDICTSIGKAFEKVEDALEDIIENPECPKCKQRKPVKYTISKKSGTHCLHCYNCGWEWVATGIGDAIAGQGWQT